MQRQVDEMGLRLRITFEGLMVRMIGQTESVGKTVGCLFSKTVREPRFSFVVCHWSMVEVRYELRKVRIRLGLV